MVSTSALNELNPRPHFCAAVQDRAWQRTPGRGMGMADICAWAHTPKHRLSRAGALGIWRGTGGRRRRSTATMTKLSTHQRARLAKALAEGGIKHVTQTGDAELDRSREDFHQLERLCIDGYLRLSRVKSEGYDPRGERAYEYQLTEKGKREARRS